ncbi:MAG: hydrophobe/amphiphile efflux-3 (HAE3) family transporter [Thermoleophilia bacterium]|jgi:hypothetical protein
MYRIFRQLGIFIENKHLLVVSICLLLIIPAIYGASMIEMASGTDTLIPPDSKVTADYKKYSENFSGQAIVVLVEGDNINQLLQKENVNAFEAVEGKISSSSGVKSVIGPAFFIKQALSQQTGGSSDLPSDTGMLVGMVTDPNTGDVRTQFSKIFPDGRHALMVILLKGGLNDSKAIDNLISDVQTTVNDAGFTGVHTIVTGEPVMLKTMNETMSKSLGYMIGMAVAMMLIILALIFKVRNYFAWRWLPLGIVVIAIIYAFGIMGFLSIPMTMVTMAAFPVLIGLGVDYAIQFHNRYDEEARRGETIAEAIVDSITHIGPAIGIAIISACLGFAALFFSPIPMIVDFGYTLIIGVVCCYLLAIFLMMAVLYWHDRSKGNGKNKEIVAQEVVARESSGAVERALHKISPGVIKSPMIIIPVALVLCVLGLVLDGRIGSETDTTKFISGDLPVMKDIETLEAVAGGQSSANILVEAGDVTDPVVLNWMASLEKRIMSEQGEIVDSATSVSDMLASASGGNIPQDAAVVRQILDSMPPTIKGNLVTEDYRAANITVSVGGLDSEQIKELNRQLNIYLEDAPAGVETVITGGVIVQDEVISGLTEGRTKMTLIGVAFVFAGILVLFRFRVVRALLAILPIGLIVGWSAIVMYSLGIVYTPITATLGALIIGVGVEFTVLLMMRYYEEREKGETAYEAMVTAMTKIGRAIIASGLTVVAGFGALLIAKDFPLLQDFGVVTMINVLFALVSTLIVLPPLIVLVDTRLGVPGTGSMPKGY